MLAVREICHVKLSPLRYSRNSSSSSSRRICSSHSDVFTPSIHPDSEAQSSTPNLKATLLLFGATGSGKTHTLRQVLPGIIDQIFSSSHLPIDPQEGHDNVAHPWSGPRTGTRITGKISISAREFSDKTVIPLHSLSLDLLPVGMGKIAPDGGIDADETAAQTGRKKVVDFINKVDKMRKTSATARNDQSSRSMLEWTVTLESTSAPSEGEGGIRRSLYLFGELFFRPRSSAKCHAGIIAGCWTNEPKGSIIRHIASYARIPAI